MKPLKGNSDKTRLTNFYSFVMISCYHWAGSRGFFRNTTNNVSTESKHRFKDYLDYNFKTNVQIVIVLQSSGYLESVNKIAQNSSPSPVGILIKTSLKFTIWNSKFNVIQSFIHKTTLLTCGKYFYRSHWVKTSDIKEEEQFSKIQQLKISR